MRIAENTNFDIVRDSITRSKAKMDKLQLESATLKKLNTPSDDPVGAAKVLEVRTEKVNNDQFQANSKLAQTFLENSDHALSELSDIILRAKEIALGQSSGASSNQETRLGVAEELAQLYEQSVATANRKVGDRYLFGGYKTQQPPVDADGRYHGDAGHMMVEIAHGVFISMNVPGVEAFNTQPKSSSDAKHLYGEPKKGRDLASTPEEQKSHPENANVFSELQNLRIALLTGDLDGIHAELDRLDQVHEKLVAERAKAGSRLNGLQSAAQAIERHNITNAQLTSTLEDADMAKVMSELAKDESVYRSALASSKNLIQPTLLEYLR